MEAYCGSIIGSSCVLLLALLFVEMSSKKIEMLVVGNLSATYVPAILTTIADM